MGGGKWREGGEREREESTVDICKGNWLTGLERPRRSTICHHQGQELGNPMVSQSGHKGPRTRSPVSESRRRAKL